MSDSLAALTDRIRSFAEERNWERFHSPKNLATALVVEAAELVEPFQWMTSDESIEVGRGGNSPLRAEVEGELADVAIYLLRLADVMGIDLGEAVQRKLAENERRFPRPPGAHPSS